LLSDPEVLARAADDSGEYETLVLQAGEWEKPDAPAPGTPAGDLHIAESLYRAEDYARAAKAFEEVADKHKDVPAVHERALFMRAESQYQLGLYARARDSYQEFTKTYPGSKHVSAAMQRLFAIADSWLEDARYDVRRGAPCAFPGRFFNVQPGRKPIFDIDGHAVEALEYVRDHDPNGPLADDALMMSAGYHFSTGDYRTAEQLSQRLLESYPRSEHQARAHLLAAESKLQSYKGPAYEGRKLEEAGRTLQAALTQFPDELESDRQQVYHKLDSIRHERAKAQFEIGEWYERIGKPNSARVYYEIVIKNFAGTKWAERAAERLTALDSADASQPSPTAAGQSPPDKERRSWRERLAERFSERSQ
jgi:outer membrane protein assembly factor BamD (BamD/ComL family)